MRIGRFEFTPGLWPTLATLVMLPLLCSLGFWQIDRAAAKRELLDGYAQHSHAAAVSVDAAAAFDVARQYHHVRISGRYDVRHQFLLDNQIHDDVPGYHVFTPLLLADGRAILVNRGWVAMGVSRDKLPALPTPEGTISVTGVLAPLPGHGVLLGSGVESDTRWPRVVMAIEPPRLQRDLGYRLSPQLVLQLDAAQPDGFIRQWKIVGFGPERNLGYAFQWFMMAVAVLAIYIGVNTRRITRGAGE